MIEPDMDVAACVVRVRQRDEDAARQLMQHLYPLVLKLVRAHLPRLTSEEDLAQIVFMKVFASLDQYAGAVPLEHWVSRIAVNACYSVLKAERARPELRWADLSEEETQVLETLALPDADLAPDQSLAAREVTTKLLERLDPADRLLLSLLHLDGHPPREVSRITGWNGSLIRVRAFRARNRLRKEFARLMSENQP
jgi:RNA polymerase sigma-70 factor, ECF subfamily